MAGSSIKLYDALQWMTQQKNPFRIEWVKHDSGEVKIIEHAQFAGQYRTKNGTPMIKFTDKEDDHKPFHTNIFSLLFMNGQKITI